MDTTQKIDEQIAAAPDWRGERLAAFRKLVRDTEPDMLEDFKWGVAVWTCNKKLVCAMSAFKDHVKFNFFKGVYLTDVTDTFNNGFTPKEHRSIDLGEGNAFDAEKLAAVIKAGATYAKNV